jgi:uncharacterized protein YkwD
MSRRILLLALVALASVLIATTVAGSAAATPRAHVARRAVFGPAVLREINRVRAQHHLAPVQLDGRMSRGAHAHSHDMARRGYFAHGSWSGRVARAAGRPHTMGEVLGWLGQSSPQGEAHWIVSAWMHSPEHRFVLLDGAFRRIGIGRVRAWFGGTHAAIYTADFASAR